MEVALGYFIYLVFRLAAWLVPLIPPSVAYRIAELIGDFLYLLNYPVRRAVLSNLECVLGQRDPQVARRIFRNLVKNHIDLFRIPRLSKEELDARMEIQGLEHFEKALAQGKGVILTSIHMGCPDVVAQWLAFRDIPVTVPAELLKPKALFDLVSSLRMRKGLRLLPVDGPLVELFRALHRGEVVGLATDRDITRSGVVVPFFGRPTRLPDGAVQLAYRTGAPIVMAFNVRNPDNTFKVWLEPPLHIPKRAGNKEKVLQEALKHIVALMEKHIKAHPDQWLVSASVWQDDIPDTRSPGEAGK